MTYRAFFFQFHWRFAPHLTATSANALALTVAIRSCNLVESQNEKKQPMHNSLTTTFFFPFSDINHSARRTVGIWTEVRMLSGQVVPFCRTENWDDSTGQLMLQLHTQLPWITYNVGIGTWLKMNLARQLVVLCLQKDVNWTILTSCVHWHLLPILFYF